MRKHDAQTPGPAHGFTLLELMVSVVASSLLMVGLMSALFIASSSLDGTGDVKRRNEGSEVLAEVLRDLRLAKTFTEKTANAVTFTVPDRDGDTFPETIRYSWTGTAGAPLLYEYNGGPAATIAEDVHEFDLSFLERSMGGGSGAVFQEFTETSESSNVISLAIDVPPGTADDDLLIAAVVTDGNTVGDLIPPAGWTELVIGHRSSKVTLGVWWKLASSEAGTYQFDWASGEQAYGWVMRFTGHDPLAPINAMTDDKETSATPTSSAVVSTVDNALILRIGGFDDDDITIDAPGLADHTAITADRSGTGLESCSGAAGYVVQPLAGSSGTSAFSLTSSEEAVVVTIAIAPGTSP